jgi:mono/diheme cytochrome c family protein
MLKKTMILLSMLVGVTGPCLAQNQTEDKTVVKQTTIKQSSATSGKEMLTEYCAACHGVDGEGNGPAASTLKVPPTDLTQLTRKHDGKYPANHVASVLKFGEGGAGAHGSAEMPVWGPLFHSLDKFHDKQRVSNVVSYMETLQGK